MVDLIVDKMAVSKQKAEHIECLMALVLALEDRFACESQIQPILAKNLKS
jgi:hypothetical protein